jgi:translocation and assembly module TamB
MRRPALVWLLIVVCWLGGTVLGLGAAAFRTAPGRRLVVELAERAANDNLRATLTIGEVGGSFLRGLEVQDVTVVGEDGVLFATIDRVGLRYRLNDLLSGRIVLGQLTLVRPRVNLVQWARGEKLNADVILSGGGDGDDGEDGGPGPLIAFNDAIVIDGSVLIRTPERRGRPSVLEGEEGPRGYLRVRRVEGINGRFPYVRIASPLPGDDAIRIEIERLRAEASDPAVSLAAARGVVEIQGDSIAMDLSRVRLPQSEAGVTGALTWFTGPLLPNLEIDAAYVVSDEVLGLARDLPPGLAGSGRFSVRALNGGSVTEIEGEEMDLTGLGGRGAARGRLGAVLGPGSDWALVGMDLDVDNFDFEFTRAVFDTLPILGRLTGRVWANGPRDDLLLGVHGTFRDSLVEGWPESYIRGEGIVAVGGPGEFVFHDFALDSADIALGTVRRLISAIDLLGRMRGSGTLNGAWLNPTYDGVLRYADAPLPETTAHGRFTVDAQGDTVGLWGDVQFDSLHLGSFESTYTGFGLQSALAGRVVFAGWLDSLEMDVQLAGPAGEVRGAAALQLLEDRRGAHFLRAELAALDLQALDSSLPVTRLDGAVEGGGVDRYDGAASGRLRLALRPSLVNGVALDSVRATVGVEDQLLQFDTLEVWARGLRLGAQGGIGIEAPRRGILLFAVASDSLGALEPTLEEWLGPLDVGEIPPRGSARLSGVMEGSLDAFALRVDLAEGDLRRADLQLTGASGRISYSPEGALAFSLAADSVGVRNLGFADVEVAAEGSLDSLDWHTRGVFGKYESGSWIGWGSLFIDSTGYTIPVDSVGLLLASGPWFLDTAAVVAVDDSGVTLFGVAFDQTRGGGFAAVHGRVPFSGPGDLTGSVDALPVGDVWLLMQGDHDLVGGEVGGTLRLAGSAELPTFRIDGNLANGVFDRFRPPYIRLVVDYRDQRLDGEVRLVRRGEPILDVEVELPLDLAFAPRERRRLDGPIRIRALADSVDLSSFEGTLPSAQELAGMLNADFGVMGTWADPVLGGRISVDGGGATLPSLGVRHDSISGLIGFSGDSILVRRLTLASGGGTAEVTGHVRLDELSKPILDLQISSDEFEAMNVADFLTLTTTADVRLQGPFFGAALTGRAEATHGVLHFADMLRKDIVNLEDSLFAQFVDTTALRRERLGRRFENLFIDSLRIDSVRVEMGRDMWLRSSEADIQLEGFVYLSRALDLYRFDGILEARRGTYQLQVGLAEGTGSVREFRVTRGQVRYLGTDDLNADLDIEAEHKVNTNRGDDITVYVNIGGTLYEPTLTLGSDARPPLSETEIFSLLVFGAPGLRAGNEGQIAQWLAWQQAFGTLSSQIGYALVSDVGIPLDYFQVNPETGRSGELAGAELVVGKRFQVLGTSALLRAKPRLCAAQTSSIDIGASLEFRLSQRWLVAASVDPLRSCESPNYNLAARYQLGLDFLWENRY